MVSEFYLNGAPIKDCNLESEFRPFTFNGIIALSGLKFAILLIFLSVCGFFGLYLFLFSFPAFLWVT